MTIIIHTLKCGFINVGKSKYKQNRFDLDLNNAFLFNRKMIKLPVFTFLIEHPKANILVDTSWSKDIRNYRPSKLNIRHHIRSGELPEGESIDEVLNKTEIDHVILTHMHPDHVDGLNNFEQPLEDVYVSEEEYQSALKNGGRYNKKTWEHLNFKTYWWNDTLGPFNKSYDFFGDGTVNLVHLPGHTKGYVGVLIKNHGKSILLTGDCGSNLEVWRKMDLSSLITNRSDFDKSMEWMKEISKEKNCLGVLSSHDAGAKSKVIKI